MKQSLVWPLVLCLLLSGCGGSAAVPPAVSEKDLIREYNSGNGTNSSIVAAHGMETRFAYGAISGTGGTNANGVGFLHTYEDGVSIVTINLNILAPAKGHHYFVWLKNDSGDPLPFGELKSIVGDARHSVVFETKATFIGDTFVYVTDETIVNPSTLSSHSTIIAKGRMKEVKRSS